jgi:hypothetical protein
MSGKLLGRVFDSAPSQFLTVAIENCMVKIIPLVPIPSSTPRSRIDTKLYSLFTITELFPMARSETFLLKVSTVIAVDL